MEFSEKLRQARMQKGLTQEKLAEMLEVSRQAVSKWESGSGYPETEKLLVLARELGVSLDYLLLDRNQMEEEPERAPKTSVYAASGKITIASFDRTKVASYHAVKSTTIFGAGKGQLKYILFGVEKVTFWGEQNTILGWYDSLEKVQAEIEEIRKAMDQGQTSYQLKYSADVEYVGLFKLPRIKSSEPDRP